MLKTFNTIHFDITYFCNYHCEYCYQGLEKQQIHISDEVFDNFFCFLSRLKEQYTVHLIGGEPFLYPRFYEMCERIVKMGHKVSCTTNFSLPEFALEKFLNIAKNNISFFEISMHLTQIKDLSEFYNKLVWFKEKSSLEYRDFQINCVLTNENFAQVKEISQKLKQLGFFLNIQRIFDDKDYEIYSEEIENWLKENKCIDIPLNMVINKHRCDVCKKPCRTGTKFFKVLIDGKVTRCFTNQHYGYNLLGDFSKNSRVKILKDFSPCLSLDNKCRCLFGFNKLGQIEHNKRKTLEFYFDIVSSKVKFLYLYIKYYFYRIAKNIKPSLKEKSKLYKKKIIQKAKVYNH